MTKREQVQQEALAIALSNKRCGLGISMGVGKTLIGLRYIQKINEGRLYKAKVLVVAPKLSIFESWKSDAEKFNINIDDVTFTTYLSLVKQPKEYNVIILDECHSLLYSHDDYLKGFPGKILGLTGTPPKWSKSEKGEMVNKYCPILYKYITDSAVEDKILNDYKIYVHMINLSAEKTILKVTKAGKKWYTSEMYDYEYLTKRCETATTPKTKKFAIIFRMKGLQGYFSKEKYARKLFSSINEKCILFANTQEQADRLCNNSYHSNNPDSESNLDSFSNGTLNKLSCVLQLNEGINIPNLRAGIIMHAYGNERKASQRIGRLLRLNPDETATVHILCYKDTVDEKWVTEALKDFDQSKITYLNL